jgi:DNA-binding NarL/FixJ family response regulator
MAGRPHGVGQPLEATAPGALSNRERQILELVMSGEPNKSIALQLDLSQKTVEKHRASLMHKMGAQNVVQLVRIVLEHQTAK